MIWIKQSIVMSLTVICYQHYNLIHDLVRTPKTLNPKTRNRFMVYSSNQLLYLGSRLVSKPQYDLWFHEVLPSLLLYNSRLIYVYQLTDALSLSILMDELCLTSITLILHLPYVRGNFYSLTFVPRAFLSPGFHSLPIQSLISSLFPFASLISNLLELYYLIFNHQTYQNSLYQKSSF